MHTLNPEAGFVYSNNYNPKAGIIYILGSLGLARGPATTHERRVQKCPSVLGVGFHTNLREGNEACDRNGLGSVRPRVKLVGYHIQTFLTPSCTLDTKLSVSMRGSFYFDGPWASLVGELPG